MLFKFEETEGLELRVLDSAGFEVKKIDFGIQLSSEYWTFTILLASGQNSKYSVMVLRSAVDDNVSIVNKAKVPFGGLAQWLENAFKEERKRELARLKRLRNQYVICNSLT